MTVEKKLSVQLTDIKSVAFVCKECGAAQSFNPATWHPEVIPHQCPNCSGARNWGASGERRLLVEIFAKSLTQVIEATKTSDKLPFDLILSFDAP